MTSTVTSTVTSTMASNVSPTYLKNKNAHPLDSNIVFDEGPHIYTINGDSDYTSVTTWNHANFEKFDADKVITKMMKIYQYIVMFVKKIQMKQLLSSMKIRDFTALHILKMLYVRIANNL